MRLSCAPRSRRPVILVTALLGLGAHSLHAQERSGARSTSGTVGTIVIAHGGSDEWNAPVLEIAGQAPTGGPVEVSFLMGDRAEDYRFQDAAERLVEQGATRIVVVPLLASSHSGHYDQIRYLAGDLDGLSDNMMHHLHMAGIRRPELEVPIQVTPALDASIEIATILSERALALAGDVARGRALFIVGHGPSSAEDYAEWMANLRPVVDSVARTTGFRDVKLGLVRDDAPEAVRAEAVRRIREIIELQNALTGRDVVVVPLLISKGYVTEKLRRDLEGLPVTYEGEGLLPHPALAQWIARRVRNAPDEKG